MKAFIRNLLVALSLFSSLGISYSQTPPTAPETEKAAVTSDLSEKIAAAQAYLGKESFDYEFKTVYQGYNYTLNRKLYPKEGYASFPGAEDYCFRGKMRAEFSVDSSTGELVVDFKPSISSCAPFRYSFDVLTKQGNVFAIDPNTKKLTLSASKIRLL